ncbi:MAG TPA: nucleotidyl transferase AbiEii/AbiGii toxin family protein [Ktedonobacterales bacterium]|jgi:hypothetical protein
MTGRYHTARAFRVALEARLKQVAQTRNLDLMRLRRQVAFDRLLARLFAVQEPPWLLKGGYTFELRLGGDAARATRDLDLSIPDLSRLASADAPPLAIPSQLIRESLRDAAERDLQDGFVFRIGEPMADLDAAPYGGAHYPVEARLDVRPFATFHLDVGIGDALVAPPEWLTGQDILNFAGIPPTRAAVLPREQQFAEKLHAYTLPHGERTNTRVKDLVDMTLLINMGLPDLDRTRQAVFATFARRQTHALPVDLNAPPASWRLPYAALAAECHLDQTNADSAFAALATYYRTLDVTHSPPVP